MRSDPVITPDDSSGYVACDPATGTTTQGDTIGDALANLREGVALYLEEFPAPPDLALGDRLH